MPGTKQSGNRTARRGRKLRRAIRLDEETARSLRVLWQFKRSLNPAITEDDIVRALINEAWREIDERGDLQAFLNRRQTNEQPKKLEALAC